MQRMRAAVFEREGVLTLKSVPVPEISRPDQVLLKVEAASICGTDVHITAVPPGYAATPGTILGHEFVGTVVKKGGNVPYLDIGDRVVVNPNDYCGYCSYCRGNMPNACENIQALGIDYNGAFAEYCLVSGKVAHKIAKGVPVELAACAEPLACAINGLKKVHVLPGDTAVLMGGGPIGLMMAMLLKRSGAEKIYLLEIAPYRMAFAESLKFLTVINPKEQDAKALILEETKTGADVVFDMTGSQMLPCAELVKKGGSLVLFGVNKRATAQMPQSLITTREIAVLGTWLANATFPESVRILETGSIDISPLITDVLPLEKIHEGIAKLASGSAVKIIVKP